METTRSGATFAGRTVSAMLFDLDGTLLDTAADIAKALNRTLAEKGLAPFPVSEVARMIGRGSPMLIQRATLLRDPGVPDAERAVMLERFFHHYGELEESADSDAKPYGNVAETLPRLHAAGLRLAVVTNKHSRFANALLQRLELASWFDVVVGGDTCARRKPDPQPLIHACESLGIEPLQAVMVGDSINDVQAARAASIPVICVPYGYNEGNDPRSLPCDAFIDTLADLPPLLWPPNLQ